MEPVSIALGGANWLIGKALGKLSGDLLEAWAASTSLANNIKELKKGLLFAHAVLHNAPDHKMDNLALAGLLEQLSQLAYAAEDLLDELDYFRIQDELEDSYEAADDITGTLSCLSFHARHAVKYVGEGIQCFACSSFHDFEPAGLQEDHRKNVVQKLKFDRVAMSGRMKSLTDQLKPICDMVSNVLNLELLRSPSPSSPRTKLLRRPETTARTVEPELYGRDKIRDHIIEELTSKKYQDKPLSVLPIVGHGGIGKTTLIQHVYKDLKVKSHFQVPIWICVSVKFDRHKLMNEILGQIPKTEDEQTNDSSDSGNLNKLETLIEKRIKSKKFLLVLDDMWECEEAEWNQLLGPLENGQAKGNMVLVTTRDRSLATMVKTIDQPIVLERLEEEVFKSYFLACIFGDGKHESKEELVCIGEKIAKQLKGVPLAAKTVTRLLKRDFSTEHWTRVLESNEWKSQGGDHDIMPALRVSYEYLPFHLQRCFSYCSLFPDDYEFDENELVHLWIALGIVHSNGQNSRMEDIGRDYLKELTDHGFFERGEGQSYRMHDLLRDLAQQVSSHECLTIDRSSPSSRSREIPPSIRHLSIITRYEEHNYNCDDHHLNEELGKLKKELKSKCLITLMLIGAYDHSFATRFREVFREIGGLRVLSINTMTYSPDFLMCNFSKLLHLRYLKLRSCRSTVHLPSTLSRLYHLMVLDLRIRFASFDLPNNFHNLINLRHFLANDQELHSKIACVGKLKFLQELREFKVKKGDNFQLRQLGELTELGGSLSIRNLENVEAKREAEDAKLIQKDRLKDLSLSWGSRDWSIEPKVQREILDSLQPHSNLQKLCLRYFMGTSCPNWLASNISVNRLETLHLEYCSTLETLPPLGLFPSLRDLKLAGIPILIEFGVAILGNPTRQTHSSLEVIELIDMQNLEKWVGGHNGSNFPKLEELTIRGCPKLTQFPFPRCSDIMEGSWSEFPSLQEIYITCCPKLVPSSPLPYAPSFRKIYFDGMGLESLDNFDYSRDLSGSNLSIRGKGDTLHSLDEKVLSFHHLCDLQELEFEKCPPPSYKALQNLTSLTSLKIKDCSKIRAIAVEELLQEEASYWGATSSSTVEVKEIIDKEEAGGGLLHIPSNLATSLRNLRIRSCLDLHFVGLLGLVSLESLEISGCNEICCFFPASLRKLTLCCLGNETLPSLSNLSSLTSLEIKYCDQLKSLDLHIQTAALQDLDIRDCKSLGVCSPTSVEGLRSIFTHLKSLRVIKCPNFFSAYHWVEAAQDDPPSFSLPLEKLVTDDPAVLTAPICNQLSSSLRELSLRDLPQVKRFTQEQEAALPLLTSLQYLQFWCCKDLHSLPTELHSLRSLKNLVIFYCQSICSLPKKGLPSSIKKLTAHHCSKELKKPLMKLRRSNPNLEIDDEDYLD